MLPQTEAEALIELSEGHVLGVHIPEYPGVDFVVERTVNGLFEAWLGDIFAEDPKPVGYYRFDQIKVFAVYYPVLDIPKELEDHPLVQEAIKYSHGNGLKQ